MGRINQLAEKTTLNSTDVIAVDAGAGGNTNKMTGANLAGQLKSLGGYQDKLTFDTTPTAGSTNPVTSGGVKTALDGKQNTLTFDSTPTAGSTNPVTSGGVANAIQQSTATVSGSAAAASGISLSTFSVRKAGNVVIIHGTATISGSIAGNLAVVFTLPDGYKPADEIYFNSIATYNGTVQPATFAINPSGQFRTRTGGGTFTGVIYVDCIYAV